MIHHKTYLDSAAHDKGVSVDEVDAVLMPDAWHFIRVGSFVSDSDSFSFITNPDTDGKGGDQLVVAPHSSLLGVRFCVNS